MRSVKDIFRDAAVFDVDGRHINGSDKESNHHYGNAYESLFVEIDPNIDTANVFSQPHIKITGRYRSTRNNVKLMMEVGIADGSCLLAWKEVFPNATIVGMDIHPAARITEDWHKKHHTESSRLEFHLGDQRVMKDCERAAAGRQFDLIIDDATHELENTLLALYWLWPFVKPGGLYVVEEWPNIDHDRIRDLWPQADIVDTQEPFGGNEPLIVFRK